MSMNISVVDPTVPEIPSLGLLRLNVGCGILRYPGEIGVDSCEVDSVDVVANVLDGMPFPDESAEFIRLDHVLEHIPYASTVRFLLEIKRLLIVGGVVRIGVPDLSEIFRAWNDCSLYEKSLLIRNIYGGQVHSEDFHKSGYDITILIDIINSCGFEEISYSKDLIRDDFSIVAWARKVGVGSS